MGEGGRGDSGADSAVHLTPEQAALSSWEPARSTSPRVVSITARGDRAEVVIETEDEYRDWVYCVRDEAGWRWVVSGNGPTVGWDDPAYIHWG
jgi:hypothetical protein